MSNTIETMCDYQIVIENAGIAAADVTHDREERIEYCEEYIRRHGAGLHPCGSCSRCAPGPAPWDAPSTV